MMKGIITGTLKTSPRIILNTAPLRRTMRKKNLFVKGISVFIAFSLPFLVGAIRAPQFLFTTQNYRIAQASVSSCLNRVNIPEAEMSWAYVPKAASELYSEDNLQWLAGRLISKKIVDASECPAGGLASNGYANACGMSTAKPKVIEVQNSLNQAILDQYTDIGVPPVLLKQLIRTESQFWPGEETPNHYGYGHVTTAGAITGLSWDKDLLATVCAQSDTTCNADSVTAEMMFQMMLNTCPTCPNGIDMTQADRSVRILSKVVMAYCDQTAQLVFNATGWRSDLVVDYPTLWKLTLMNYNAGPDCVFNTVASAFKRTNGPVDWENIEAVIATSQCSRGAYYANQITTNDYNFPPK
jgi:hypothetical protein